MAVYPTFTHEDAIILGMLFAKYFQGDVYNPYYRGGYWNDFGGFGGKPDKTTGGTGRGGDKTINGDYGRLNWVDAMLGVKGQTSQSPGCPGTASAGGFGWHSGDFGYGGTGKQTYDSPIPSSGGGSGWYGGGSSILGAGAGGGSSVVFSDRLLGMIPNINVPSSDFIGKWIGVEDMDEYTEYPWLYDLNTRALTYYDETWQDKLDKDTLAYLENIHDTCVGNGLCMISKVNEKIRLTSSGLQFTGLAKTMYYTGHMQVYEIPTDGIYHFILWGAAGGDAYIAKMVDGKNLTKDDPTKGGFGGYASGYFYFTAGTRLYIFVGQYGGSAVWPRSWNGGGIGSDHCKSGGGATDIRWDFSSLLCDLGTAAYNYAVTQGFIGSNKLWYEQCVDINSNTLTSYGETMFNWSVSQGYAGTSSEWTVSILSEDWFDNLGQRFIVAGGGGGCYDDGSGKAHSPVIPDDGSCQNNSPTDGADINIDNLRFLVNDRSQVQVYLHYYTAASIPDGSTITCTIYIQGGQDGILTQKLTAKALEGNLEFDFNLDQIYPDNMASKWVTIKADINTKLTLVVPKNGIVIKVITRADINESNNYNNSNVLYQYSDAISVQDRINIVLQDVISGDIHLELQDGLLVSDMQNVLETLAPTFGNPVLDEEDLGDDVTIKLLDVIVSMLKYMDEIESQDIIKINICNIERLIKQYQDENEGSEVINVDKRDITLNNKAVQDEDTGEDSVNINLIDK